MVEQDLLAALRGRLIVSCQAWPDDPFAGSDSAAKFARAAVEGGAGGIRANGPEDIAAIRKAVDVPVIGIQKALHGDGRILITPTFEAAESLCRAGAAIVAVDCTARGCAAGALDRLRRIRAELGVPVMADIATLEEARAAAAHGAAFVGSTMRGYTDETRHVTSFDASFVALLAASLPVPVIAEGMIWTPEEVRAALDAGAHAVVVGTAITRPRDITRRFVQAIKIAPGGVCAGIDCGGTNIKYGLVTARGELLFRGVMPTPAGSRAVLLDALRRALAECRAKAASRDVSLAAAGLATAGWVDPGSGVVVSATDNLPGWQGTNLLEELGEAAGVPLSVENDANAFAVAEHRYGAARGVDDFVCITLGTGVGGGCFSGGRLLRGARARANALGHICVEPDGIECTCGLRGCLECYANAGALLRNAGAGAFPDAGELIRAAHLGHPAARESIATQARYLARGLALAAPILDPALVVLSGGLADGNTLLLGLLREALDPTRIRVELSPLGYHAGVIGAAACAFMRS